MKLSEIVVTDQHAAVDDAHANTLIARVAKDGAVAGELTASLTLYHYENFYAVVRNGEGVGYAEFSAPKQVQGTTYLELKMIFVREKFQKTRASGPFLLGLQKYLPHPLLLGSSVWGGVLFKGGRSVAQALLGSDAFTASILNLQTGEKTKATSNDLRTSKNKTLVVEQEDIPFLQEGAIHKCFVFSDEL